MTVGEDPNSGTNASSLLQIRRPVEDHGQGGGVGLLFSRGDDEKPLAVGGDGVRMDGDIEVVGLEERPRLAGLQRGIAPDLDGRELLVRRHVEDLLAVSAPFRKAPAIGRDLPLGAGRRESLDVNLLLPRLIRDVSEPSSIRREMSLTLVELGPEKRYRFTVAEER